MITKIKELRTKLGMTQEELATKVGVRRETIIFLEQGKYNPSLKLAYDVAKAMKAKHVEDVFVFDD
jgi:putative transcriptional regulator